MAHNNLGAALRDKGQLDEAIAEFREAIHLKKDVAAVHYNLGNALLAREQSDEAIAELREAIRLKKDFAEGYCNLGSVLEQKGQFAEALVYRRRGHELGSKNPRWPYPSAQWVRNCERLSELDGKLSALLSGQRQPFDTAERLAVADLCQQSYKQLYAAAARFYAEAFAGEPKLTGDRPSHHYYNAACAAALAGCGQGHDAASLDDKERARLRQQARTWLLGQLAAWAQLLEKGPAKTRPAVAQQLQHWLEDSDFAGVRGADALARLPEAERQDWQILWQEVEALRKRAAGQPISKSQPPPK
jgi:tetratricopeptide (TPR) repeat protein